MTQEGSESDPWPEFAAPGNETGLEEGFWQLGLGEEESGYPERPDEADCGYYLRTGVCGFGSRCRFNHPRDRGAVLNAARIGSGEFPERSGQPVCQHYMRTGTCKFGSSCKYHHPKQGGGSVSPVSLNYLGYPLRPGEKECTYYLNTGKCKFGASCKFHHPEPATLQITAQSPAPQVAALPAPALYPAIQPSPQQYGLVVARPPLVPGFGPYGQVLLSSSVVPYPGWSPYPASVSPHTSPSAQPVVGSGVYGITQLSPSTPAYTVAYQLMPAPVGDSISSQMGHSFPERPGQPECQHYMKTGDCKFGSSCRYHHPPELVNPKANVVLSPIGLPLRPGAPPCTNYSLQGDCRFGPACRFNHPMGTISYSPSASSLTDIPIATYPVGPMIATLSGKSGPICQPTPQQSGQRSNPSTGSSSKEAHP